MKYPHYFKSVKHLTHVDIYRILDLYQVRCPVVGHAIKKLLVPGGRGAKDYRKDLEEARDTINRKLQMMEEDDVGDKRQESEQDSPIRLSQPGATISSTDGSGRMGKRVEDDGCCTCANEQGMPVRPLNV